ncbi:hypothetical protein JCM19239_1114 [Vibrio variabilis]|uniref:Uncharacterized protein n=1 Tax=Vibrio variabilis TaxID=990271 RepID=A0ABQ0JEC2_9VIBR|nr:hypothetical protein JCM19239_1114 [Vibrio variabilis]
MLLSQPRANTGKAMLPSASKAGGIQSMKLVSTGFATAALFS